MKRITFLLLSALLLNSCGRNNEEQMLYDYQQKNLSSLNINLEDVDFKIIKIEKESDVFASDSMIHVKKDLAKIWTNNPSDILEDTLSFDYVKNTLRDNITLQDTLIAIFQKTVLSMIEYDNYSLELEYKNKRDKALNEKLSLEYKLIDVQTLENYYNKLSERPDSILSTKYFASYTFKNPLLQNTKQTFNKNFYTDSKQSMFIKQEEKE